MEVAMGFINVANEAMCRPIRALTQVREFAKFITGILSAFELNVTKVFFTFLNFKGKGI